jgi:hypothetical protein
MKKIVHYFFAVLFIASLSSCYTTQSVPYSNYSFSLVDDKGDVTDSVGPLTYVDSSLAASFDIGKKDISFVLRNQTPNTIKVLWDESLFIKNGSPGKVMHGGVKFTDRNQSMPPSVVPAGTTFEDVIVPSENVYWKEGYYSQYGSSPGGWEKNDLLPSNLSKGDKIGVFMPMNIGGSTKEYNFTFRIDDSKTEYKQVRTMDVVKTTWLTIGLTVVPLIILLSSY